MLRTRIFLTGGHLPALEAAQREGVTVWLVHGPRGTYAGELWDLADDRFHFDERAFVNAIRRVRGV